MRRIGADHARVGRVYYDGQRRIPADRPLRGMLRVVEAVLKRCIRFSLAVVLVAAAHPLAAQEARDPQPRVPESFTVPAGLCRLWIDGVPASRQPAPTDCASAIRNRPANAAVVFGPQRRGASALLRSFGRAGRPNALTGGKGDDPRERASDSTIKSVPRKPEKPQ